MFSLAFIASSFRVNCTIWPILFFKYFSLLLKELTFISYSFSAAGVVSCDRSKKQFIFFFWSFEISGNIQRN